MSSPSFTHKRSPNAGLGVRVNPLRTPNGDKETSDRPLTNQSYLGTVGRARPTIASGDCRLPTERPSDTATRPPGPSGVAINFQVVAVLTSSANLGPPSGLQGRRGSSKRLVDEDGSRGIRCAARCLDPLEKGLVGRQVDLDGCERNRCLEELTVCHLHATRFFDDTASEDLPRTTGETFPTPPRPSPSTERSSRDLAACPPMHRERTSTGNNNGNHRKDYRRSRRSREHLLVQRRSTTDGVPPGHSAAWSAVAVTVSERVQGSGG